MEIKILAAVLSALYPGIGQLKNREVAKGLFLFLLFTILLAIGFYPGGSTAQLICVASLPLVWVAAVVDASQMFMVQPGYAPGKQQRKKMALGVLLFWLLIELLFVPLVWNRVHHREASSQSQLEVHRIPSPPLFSWHGDAARWRCIGHISSQPPVTYAPAVEHEGEADGARVNRMA